jgi:hypothetical protein
MVLSIPGYRPMEDDKFEEEGKGGFLKNSLSQLVAAAAFAVIAASIRLWAGVELIQKDVSTLAKSDAVQSEQISTIKSNINDLQVKFGVLKVVVDMIRK